MFTGVRGGPTRLQQPLSPIPTKYTFTFFWLTLLLAKFSNRSFYIFGKIICHGSFYLPGDQHECLDSCQQTGEYMGKGSLFVVSFCLEAICLVVSVLSFVVKELIAKKQNHRRLTHYYHLLSNFDHLAFTQGPA